MRGDNGHSQFPVTDRDRINHPLYGKPADDILDFCIMAQKSSDDYAKRYMALDEKYHRVLSERDAAIKQLSELRRHQP